MFRKVSCESFQASFSMVTLVGNRAASALLFRVAELVRVQRAGVGGPGVGDEVVAIRVDRLREPSARFTLVILEPGYALLNSLVVGRHSRLTQDVDDKACRVSIAGRIAIVRSFVIADPVAEHR